MMIAHFFNEKILLPISDMITGHNTSSDLKMLLESQWWTSDRIREYQERKLRLLVEHAYENVPYYNNLFKENKLKPSDIRTKEDLRKIPILKKSTIKKHHNDSLVARNISPKNRSTLYSSGSTGEPLGFYISNNAFSMRYATAIRGWYWMGYRLGDKYVKLSQNPRNSKLKRIQDWMNNCKYLFSQQLIEENFKKLVSEIREFRPKILRGYPDPLLFLAKYIQQNGIDDVQVPIIATTGNILFPEARALIQEQFHSIIFDSYSCEGTPNIAECPTHECYHAASEYAITEVLSDGEEVAPGEKGRLYTTDLFNYATPFLRYDTQDILVRSEKPCSCGRNLPAFSRILGRDNDILITPSGKYLIVHNFTGYFEYLEEVNAFQVYQKDPDHIIIKIVINDNFNNDTEKAILKYWYEYIGNDVKIELQIVDEIPPNPKNGKRRFLLRDSSIPLNLYS